MQSIKTGLVVVVLLGVLYGVYRLLNMPDLVDGPEATAPPIEIDEGTAYETNEPIIAGDGTAAIITPLSDPLKNPLSPPRSLDEGLGDQQSPADIYPPQENGLGGSTSRKDRLGPRQAITDAPNQPAPSYPSTDAPLEPHPPHDDFADGGLDEGAAAINLREFASAWRTAEEEIHDGRFRDALKTLSQYYFGTGLAPHERERLVAWLDALAGKVIYSTEHHLAEPYEVRPGETLASIAERHQVPTKLLQNINLGQHVDTRVPQVGTKLKVLRGPFQAYVDVRERRLTLFLGELYAGHFPLDVAEDAPLHGGRYRVKLVADESVIVLDDDATIHSSRGPGPYGNGKRCISLLREDAADVTAILSQGSDVVIRR